MASTLRHDDLGEAVRPERGLPEFVLARLRLKGYRSGMKPLKSVVSVISLALMFLVGCTPKAPRTPIHEAVQKGDAKTVQMHVASRSDLNVKNKFGFGPMHIAAMKGDVAIVKILVAGGADPFAAGPGGQTPLDMARAQSKSTVVQYLQGIQPKQGGGGRGLVDGGLGVSEAMGVQ